MVLGKSQLHAECGVGDEEGERVFCVRDREIPKGQEIWNHYTDVDEADYRVRRGRLREVLGGECMCERCVQEGAGVKVVP